MAAVSCAEDPFGPGLRGRPEEEKSRRYLPSTKALYIHIEHGDKVAKYWLNPIELAESEGFRSHELTRVRALVIEHRALFLEKWDEHFGNPT